MECGLPVEDDEVSVSDVPLDFVPTLEVEVRRLRVVAQVDAGTIVSHNILGSRILIVTTLH